MAGNLATYGLSVKPPMALRNNYRAVMARKGTHRQVDQSLRVVLKANVRLLQKMRPDLQSSDALGERAKIGQRTALRAMNGSRACTIDTVHALAVAFGVAAWQLLLPGFAGDPRDVLDTKDDLAKVAAHLGKAAERTT